METIWRHYVAQKMCSCRRADHDEKISILFLRETHIRLFTFLHLISQFFFLLLVVCLFVEVKCRLLWKFAVWLLLVVAEI